MNLPVSGKSGHTRQPVEFCPLSEEVALQQVATLMIVGTNGSPGIFVSVLAIRNRNLLLPPLKNN